MAYPADERLLAELPMSGGAITVCLEDEGDIAEVMPLLRQQGLFVRTQARARPFCEFSLTLRLPDGADLDPLPARLVQVIPHGDPGLMLQILRGVADWCHALENYGKPAAPEPVRDLTPVRGPDSEPSLDALDITLEPETEPDDEIFEDEDVEIELSDNRAASEEARRITMWNSMAGLNRVELLEHLRSMNPTEKARLAKRANRNVRSVLMRDSEPIVVVFMLQNPQLTRQEVVEISKLTNLNYQAVTAILANKQWANSEDIRYNLVRNPKTPMTHALKLIPQLSMKHLRELAKDWGLKTQIKQTALRLVVQRSESGHR